MIYSYSDFIEVLVSADSEIQGHHGHVKGSEDMQFSMVEPEDIPDRGEEKKNKKLHKITTSGLSFQFSPVVISLLLYGINSVCCLYLKPEHTVLTWGIAAILTWDYSFT